MFAFLAGCKIRSMRPIFKTEMLIHQSKANIDETILFGKITCHLYLEIWKILAMGMFRNKDSIFHSGP